MIVNDPVINTGRSEARSGNMRGLRIIVGMIAFRSRAGSHGRMRRGEHGRTRDRTGDSWDRTWQ
jgi:hypothetical protein